LLAFLLLYNPYVIAQGSGNGLTVEPPVSHRATVGSSELERYSSLGSQDTHVFVYLFFARPFSILLNLTSQSFLPQGSERLPMRQVFCASLWFRPPPVL